MEKKYAHENTTRMPNGKTEINGIDVGYYIDTYKWVPTDYELSAEDKANLRKSFFLFRCETHTFDFSVKDFHFFINR